MNSRLSALIERARSHRPITSLTLIGVLLLPAILGGVLVAALQDPTQRLDTMTAAIVNDDKPVTVNGQLAPLGRQLSAGLVDGTGTKDRSENLTWVISNEKDGGAGAEGRHLPGRGAHPDGVLRRRGIRAAPRSRIPRRPPRRRRSR